MKCLRCGKCCTSRGIFRQSGLIEKIVYRAILVKRYGVTGFRNPKCPHLRVRHRNTYCAIYESRPDFCRKYFCKKAQKENSELTEGDKE